MSDLLIQIFLFMSCTFIFGVALGWLVWGFGSGAKQQQQATEADFWRNNLEQNRLEHQNDLRKMEALVEEKQQLKRRIATMTAQAKNS